MPEGDTLYRTAQSLRVALQGRRITAAKSSATMVDANKLVDHNVSRIEPRGKHLLIFLGDGLAIHSHLGMTGAWHVYATGDRWRKPLRNAALVLVMDNNHEAVCFTPKTLELLSATELRRHRWLSRLGPDILDPDLDTTEIIRRFRAHDPAELGVAIMNQTIVSGIGNVYKSELLFLQGLDPFALVQNVTDEQLQALIEQARRLMRKNLAGYPRTTRFASDGQRQWVYRRVGQRCLKCSDIIHMRRQGDLARSTYYCRQCQQVSAQGFPIGPDGGRRNSQPC